MANEEKINRDGFVYLEPTEKSYGKPEDYSSCQTCTLWAGEERKRCLILGKNLEVEGKATCCLYINGKPQEDRSGGEKSLMTPKEAGFYPDRVQCKRCIYFNPLISACKLFFILDTEFPDDFSLGSKVDANGCCNAWVSKDKKQTDAIVRYLGKEYSLDELFGRRKAIFEESVKEKKKNE